jgi:hypothetical protein
MTARQQIRVARLGRERSLIDAQPTPTVGEMLQAAREKKGVDLYRAERDTKIRARHLAALESGDYTELPGSVYTKGFLRNYALYLGLDPEELLGRWRAEQDYGRRGEPVDVTAPPQPISEPHRGFTFTPGIAIAAVLSVIVLLFAGYIGLQLVRFAQVPDVTLQGDRVMNLAPDARTVVLRGTAGPRAIINISGANGEIVRTTSADDTGGWFVELDVSKGQNDFTLVARDPDTGRESSPLPVIAIVPVSATDDPPAGQGVPSTPAPAAAPGATPLGASPIDPKAILSPGHVAARLLVTSPSDRQALQNKALKVHGTTDAATVTVRATWRGPAGQDGSGDPGTRPVRPEPQELKVQDGAFDTALVLPEGRWDVTVTTGTSDSLASTTASRLVEVKLSGVFVTVEARGGSARIRVWVDDKLVAQGRTLRKGELAEFRAKRTVVVSTSDARNTYVVVDGVSHGSLTGAGRVATWSFEKGKEPRALP